MTDLSQAAAVVDALNDHRLHHAADDIVRPVDPVQLALWSIFGGSPEAIEVPHIDHLCMTLTPHHVELLLRAGGPRWVALLNSIAAKRAELKAAKNPGIDTRNMTDEELKAHRKATRA